MSTHTTPTTDALAEALRDFVRWNTKYPSSRVYGYGDIQRIAFELDTINAKAQAVLAQYDAAKRSAHLDAPHNSSAHTDAAKAASSGAQSDWQPISTAPQDGTWLLCCHKSQRAFIGRWRHKEWVDAMDGWRDPTHWMPLPARAAQGKGGGSSAPTESLNQSAGEGGGR